MIAFYEKAHLHYHFLRLDGLRCIQAAPASSTESNFQLTIELRDGSRVVRKTLDDTFSFHFGALGDMKLS
jgi:hypothetical protein